MFYSNIAHLSTHICRNGVGKGQSSCSLLDYVLTHCDLVTQCGDIDLNSGKYLLLNGINPLPQTMLTSHQRGCVIFT